MLNSVKTLEPICWNADKEIIEVIDQRLLPYELKWVVIKNSNEAATAIKDMIVRGAPLIGITAAYGMAFAAKHGEDLCAADALLRGTRPTAVNLMWALDQSKAVIDMMQMQSSQEIYQELLKKAHWIFKDDIERCHKMSQLGADYIIEKFGKRKFKIMTHCNAGALATGGYGTALGVIRKLYEMDCVEMVYSNETRPRQQGSRLTAWELAHDSIPVTMLADTMAAHMMKQGKIDFVVTGADRITANGDAANKIGTYQVAIASQYHQIPFFMAAPYSSIDTALSSGDLIEIEERASEEVTHINDKTCTAAKGVSVENPAFDVTPSHLIEAIFTEDGLFKN